MHCISASVIKTSVFPFTYGAYWFISAYLLLYIFSPLLNKILKHSKPALIRLYLSVCTILWVVVPIIMHNDFYYSTLLYFMYLYVLGGAIKLGYVKFNQKYLSAATIVVVIYLIVNILLHLKHTNVDLWRIFKYMELNTIYTLVVSIYIFNIFSKLNLKYNKIINSIASSTFGVYLLHENFLVRPCLWHKIFHVHTLMNNKLFSVEVLLISLVVFVVCVVFDKILSVCFSPLIDKIIKKSSSIYRGAEILSNQKSWGFTFL